MDLQKTRWGLEERISPTLYVASRTSRAANWSWSLWGHCQKALESRNASTELLHDDFRLLRNNVDNQQLLSRMLPTVPCRMWSCSKWLSSSLRAGGGFLYPAMGREIRNCLDIWYRGIHVHRCILFHRAFTVERTGCPAVTAISEIGVFERSDKVDTLGRSSGESKALDNYMGG